MDFFFCVFLLVVVWCSCFGRLFVWEERVLFVCFPDALPLN